MNRMHRNLQKGLGLLGAIIVLLLAGAGAYYLYQQMSGGGGGGGEGGGAAVSSCKSDLERCMQKCRKSSSDSDAAQACQKVCRNDARICENLERQSSR